MARFNPRPAIARFLANEAAGGLVLTAAAAVALIVANSPLSSAYHALVEAPVLGVTPLEVVNDGLMALFFLLVGMEIKRELVSGELSSWQQRMLPGLAAAGGMLVPALIYAAINLSSPATLRGWAIPSATDIAFSLAVMTLLGSRVPTSLKVFLAALAIIDDLGAIIIIALFYSSGIDPLMLLFALAAFLVLVVFNLLDLRNLVPYLLVGALLWYFVLRSGIHATIAGVLLAMTIPIGSEADRSPLVRLRDIIHRWVAFGILPLFGFLNAGVQLTGLGTAALVDPVTLGIALGLFIGKQVGVFSTVALAVRAGLARYPTGATLTQVYGTAILCGIGFTMSLFIGLLAFANDPEHHDATKIGVLIGSLTSAVVGFLVLRLASRRSA
ncbi:MAG: Na+/H+ antiporter NhaA [Rhizobiales bacterium]|nr:Na+/H+ antiporter NhaA [Hyphomicrobiales bacterium]